MENKLFMKEVEVKNIGTLYKITKAKKCESAIPFYVKKEEKFLVIMKNMAPLVYRRPVGIYVYNSDAKKVLELLKNYSEFEFKVLDNYEAAKTYEYSRKNAFRIDLSRKDTKVKEYFKAHVYSNNTKVEMDTSSLGTTRDTLSITVATIYPKPWQTIVADYHSVEAGRDIWNRHILHGKLNKQMKMYTIYE